MSKSMYALAEVLPAFVDGSGSPLRLVFNRPAAHFFLPGDVIEYDADDQAWRCRDYVLLPYFLRGLILSGVLDAVDPAEVQHAAA